MRYQESFLTVCLSLLGKTQQVNFWHLVQKSAQPWSFTVNRNCFTKLMQLCECTSMKYNYQELVHSPYRDGADWNIYFIKNNKVHQKYSKKSFREYHMSYSSNNDLSSLAGNSECQMDRFVTCNVPTKIQIARAKTEIKLWSLLILWLPWLCWVRTLLKVWKVKHKLS